ncbi:Gfo/Idh/MocA family oxidoreductase [uncultured Martelella sp.]|uniref:Gfo/Idh/MocA family protein n=1 Tax=uncultured Martelella sp. TaxID=392331 RepID=UPI0029C673E8|nr:Gfo/Idh/MocA family oxidoreductase [uncultured Martelella sp.]
MAARVALIGIGMGSDAHVRAIAASENLVLHGVLSRNQQRAGAFCKTYGEQHDAPVPVAYADLEALVADDAVDFVIVCTPPDARTDIVNALCAAKKPILMEKPVERTLEQATTIVERCEQAGIPLGIVLQHRMRDASMQLVDLLESGRFGPIGVVEINVSWWRPQSYYDEPGRGTYARDGGGVLISQAIHPLDLALSLCGPVSRVQAMTRTSSLHRMEAEDFVAAGLDFANGACGSLVASTASFPGMPESIAIHCEEASVRLQSGQIEVHWRNGDHELLGETTTSGGGADPMAFPYVYHQRIIEDFAEAIATGRDPAVTGRKALDVHKLIAALVRSSKEQQAVSVN